MWRRCGVCVERTPFLGTFLVVFVFLDGAWCDVAEFVEVWASGVGVAPPMLLTAVARAAVEAVSVEALCRAIDYTMKRVTVDPFFTTVPASGSV